MAERRVVVTGMGVITGLGETVDTFWNNLIAGESGVRRVTLFDATRFDSQIGGEVTTFREDKYVDRKSAKRLDPGCGTGCDRRFVDVEQVDREADRAERVVRSR